MLSKWVQKAKNGFNETQSIATENKNNKLKTSVDREEFTLDDEESLLEGIILTRKRYNNIADVDTILKLRVKKNRKK